MESGDSDAPPHLTELQQAELTDALRRILDDRAVIEQVTGVLMVIYGITADQAFAKLRECSQNSNIKLHEIAHQLLDDIREVNGRGLPSHTAVEQLLRTAHQRIQPRPSRSMPLARWGRPDRLLGEPVRPRRT